MQGRLRIIYLLCMLGTIVTVISILRSDIPPMGSNSRAFEKPSHKPERKLSARAQDPHQVVQKLSAASLRSDKKMIPQQNERNEQQEKSRGLVIGGFKTSKQTTKKTVGGFVKPQGSRSEHANAPPEPSALNQQQKTKEIKQSEQGRGSSGKHASGNMVMRKQKPGPIPKTGELDNSIHKPKGNEINQRLRGGESKLTEKQGSDEHPNAAHKENDSDTRHSASKQLIDHVDTYKHDNAAQKQQNDQHDNVIDIQLPVDRSSQKDVSQPNVDTIRSVAQSLEQKLNSNAQAKFAEPVHPNQQDDDAHDDAAPQQAASRQPLDTDQVAVKYAAPEKDERGSDGTAHMAGPNDEVAVAELQKIVAQSDAANKQPKDTDTQDNSIDIDLSLDIGTKRGAANSNELQPNAVVRDNAVDPEHSKDQQAATDPTTSKQRTDMAENTLQKLDSQQVNHRSNDNSVAVPAAETEGVAGKPQTIVQKSDPGHEHVTDVNLPLEIEPKTDSHEQKSKVVVRDNIVNIVDTNQHNADAHDSAAPHPAASKQPLHADENAPKIAVLSQVQPESDGAAHIPAADDKVVVSRSQKIAAKSIAENKEKQDTGTHDNAIDIELPVDIAVQNSGTQSLEHEANAVVRDDVAKTVRVKEQDINAHDSAAPHPAASKQPLHADENAPKIAVPAEVQPGSDGRSQKIVPQSDVVHKQSQDTERRDNIIDIKLPVDIDTHKSASQLHAEHHEKKQNEEKKEKVVPVLDQNIIPIETNEYIPHEPVVEQNAQAAKSVGRSLSQNMGGGYHPADLLLWLKADEGLESGANVSPCVHARICWSWYASIQVFANVFCNAYTDVNGYNPCQFCLQGEVSAWRDKSGTFPPLDFTPTQNKVVCRHTCIHSNHAGTLEYACDSTHADVVACADTTRYTWS